MIRLYAVFCSLKVPARSPGQGGLQDWGPSAMNKLIKEPA